MDAFQNIGLIIILGFIVYLVYFYYNKYQHQLENFEVQGGSKSAQVSQGIGEAATKQSDILLISKYRKNYESIVDNMKKYIGSNVVQLMLQVDSSSPTLTDANLKVFNDINTLKTTYNHLDSILTYIDEAN